MKQTFDLSRNTNTLRAVFSAIREIFEKGQYADKALERTFKLNRALKGAEKGFVAETVYDMVRYWRLLLTVAGLERPANDQHWWTLIGIYLIKKGYTPAGEKFSALKEEKILSRIRNYSRVRKISCSVPDWLDDLCSEELQDRWESVLKALNEPPSLIIRANSLKVTPEKLRELLLEEENIGVVPHPVSPTALELTRKKNVFRTRAFKEGFFEVQDAASQAVSDFLEAAPGMRVIDACAGAGGKTLHLGALMKNKGKIIAMDTDATKLQELRKRAARAGLQNLEIKHIDSNKVVKRLYGSADRLLLDVPCTGLGVLRRNPDARWILQEGDLERVRTIQKNILSGYSGMLKPGGRMVYSTCSILPSESEQQVKEFLRENENRWRLISEKRYWPDTDNCDGFYMALLERIG